MIIAQKIYASLNNFNIMAIPLFLIAGNIMAEARISDKLVALADLLVGKCGGLAHVCTGARLSLARSQARAGHHCGHRIDYDSVHGKTRLQKGIIRRRCGCLRLSGAHYSAQSDHGHYGVKRGCPSVSCLSTVAGDFDCGRTDGAESPDCQTPADSAAGVIGGTGPENGGSSKTV